MFPTWPAKSEMMKRPKKKDVEHSPQAPEGGAMFARLVSGGSGVGHFLEFQSQCFCVLFAKPFWFYFLNHPFFPSDRIIIWLL